MKSWFAGVMAWGRTCLGKIFQKIMKKYNFWGRHDDIYIKPGQSQGLVKAGKRQRFRAEFVPGTDYRGKEAGCSRDLDQEK